MVGRVVCGDGGDVVGGVLGVLGGVVVGRVCVVSVCGWVVGWSEWWACDEDVWAVERVLVQLQGSRACWETRYKRTWAAGTHRACACVGGWWRRVLSVPRRTHFAQGEQGTCSVKWVGWQSGVW